MSAVSPTSSKTVKNYLPTGVSLEVQQRWLEAVWWAIGVPEIIASFSKDTGMELEPGSRRYSFIFGPHSFADPVAVFGFIEWFNRSIWYGHLDG